MILTPAALSRFFQRDMTALKGLKRRDGAEGVKKRRDGAEGVKKDVTVLKGVKGT